MTEKKGSVVRRVLGGVLAGLTYGSIVGYFDERQVISTGISGALWWIYVPLVVLALYAMIADKRLPFNGVAVIISVVMLIFGQDQTPNVEISVMAMLYVIHISILLPGLFLFDWLFLYSGKPAKEQKAE